MTDPVSLGTIAAAVAGGFLSDGLGAAAGKHLYESVSQQVKDLLARLLPKERSILLDNPTSDANRIALTNSVDDLNNVNKKEIADLLNSVERRLISSGVPTGLSIKLLSGGTYRVGHLEVNIGIGILVDKSDGGEVHIGTLKVGDSSLGKIPGA